VFPELRRARGPQLKRDSSGDPDSKRTGRLMPAQPDAPVHVVAYDTRWPALFELERTALADILGPWLTGPIEHIGSTAVPGLPAKPVIDIMAAVESLDASRDALPPLRAFGYRYAPYRPDVMHWLCKPDFARRSHHLHLVPFRSALWQDRLRFRDCLRSTPAIAAEYATLKYRLAEIHKFDREAYTEAKGPFIARVLQPRAEAEPLA
jgi:GrpB-like predicted nucleotidyltransferase (UPF0157 family)